MLGLELAASYFVKKGLKKFADESLSERIASSVKKHAFMASLVMILPTFGLDTILFFFVLWHMYKRVCDLANISFWDHFLGTVLLAVIVNIVLAFFASLILSFIPLGDSLIAFVQIIVSGVAYLKALTQIYENKG